MFDLGDENAIRGYQEIIETYRDQKQWQMATTTAEEAAKKFPNDRSLQMVAASQRADLGDSAAAIAQVKLMLKGTADDRDVYIALAQMYSRIEGLAAGGSQHQQGAGTVHQAGRQELCQVRRRLDLRAAEEIRTGGRVVPQGHWPTIPRTRRP